MDPGSDPGRDEYGLPPVDIEVPDDARDLDRDVQAYHRELRARRRHVRVRRLTGPLTRHGMIMPLVAACLAVTLLTGTLLTVLAGRRVPLLLSRTPQSTAPRRPSPVSPGRQLPSVPNAQVMLDGRQVGLPALVPAVLAWVPVACGCGPRLRQLAALAAASRVRIYLVGTARAVAELSALAGEAGLGYGHDVVSDPADTLVNTYSLMGLTAILARGDTPVAAPDVVRNLQSRLPQQQLKARLQSLASVSRGPAAAPAAQVQEPGPQAS